MRKVASCLLFAASLLATEAIVTPYSSGPYSPTLGIRVTLKTEAATAAILVVYRDLQNVQREVAAAAKPAGAAVGPYIHAFIPLGDTVANPKGSPDIPAHVIFIAALTVDQNGTLSLKKYVCQSFGDCSEER